MRRFMSVLMALVVMAAMMVALAGPAVANDHRDFRDRFDFDRFDFDRFGFDRFGFDRFDFVEQEAETGEIEQSFKVVNTGNNSNQCAGIQGVANTGTNQNFQGFLQTGNFEPEIELEEAGLFTISSESETSCIQEVNQAAAAGK